MVKPVEDALDLPNDDNNSAIMERNDNQRRRDDLVGATNEKIDQPNRAFPSSFLFNRQIIVNEEESVLRNVNDKQVMNFKL